MKNVFVILLLAILVSGCRKDCETKPEGADTHFSKQDWLGEWDYTLYGDTNYKFPIHIGDSHVEGSVFIYYPFTLGICYFIAENDETWDNLTMPRQILLGSNAPDNGIALSGSLWLSSDKDTLYMVIRQEQWSQDCTQCITTTYLSDGVHGDTLIAVR
jgi:hypothetical protein